MTLMEMLKSLFGDKLDQEIDTVNTNEEQKEDKPNEDKPNEDKPPEENNESPNEESKDDGIIIEDGWLKEDGTIDASKVKNEIVLGALQTIIAKNSEVSNTSKIETALDEAISKASINVSAKTFRSMLDISEVKVENGTVVGIDKAFEKLKAEESGLFKDIETPGNPLDSGFNPVEVKGKAMPNSFEEAFQMTTELQ